MTAGSGTGLYRTGQTWPPGPPTLTAMGQPGSAARLALLEHLKSLVETLITQDSGVDQASMLALRAEIQEVMNELSLLAATPRRRWTDTVPANRMN